MTPRAKLIQELQREGVRLWREGIRLANLEEEPTPAELELQAEAEAETALAFAGTLEELAPRLNPPGDRP